MINDIWIVIPTFNECTNLPKLLSAIFSLPENLTVLVVDDNSPDGTGQLADNLTKKYPRLFVLQRAGKLGLGSAYRAGFAYALAQGAEVVGEMDADRSHNPNDLPKLIAAVNAGADVVIGSRRVPGGKIIGWGLWRHIMSWGAMFLARLVLQLKTYDVTSGFRLYTKNALGSIPWAKVKSDGYAWQEEILYLCERAGFKVVEVPVVFEDRKLGKSKLGLKQVEEFFGTLIRLFV